MNAMTDNSIDNLIREAIDRRELLADLDRLISADVRRQARRASLGTSCCLQLWATIGVDYLFHVCIPLYKRVRMYATKLVCDDVANARLAFLHGLCPQDFFAQGSVIISRSRGLNNVRKLKL